MNIVVEICLATNNKKRKVAVIDISYVDGMAWVWSVRFYLWQHNEFLRARWHLFHRSEAKKYLAGKTTQSLNRKYDVLL